MDADDNDRRKLIEEFERLQAGQSRAEPDIERLFDQAVRWRFGAFISEAIASANVKARQSR
jgi:hypothetical protein